MRLRDKNGMSGIYQSLLSGLTFTGCQNKSHASSARSARLKIVEIYWTQDLHMKPQYGNTMKYQNTLKCWGVCSKGLWAAKPQIGFNWNKKSSKIQESAQLQELSVFAHAKSGRGSEAGPVRPLHQTPTKNRDDFRWFPTDSAHASTDVVHSTRPGNGKILTWQWEWNQGISDQAWPENPQCFIILYICCYWCSIFFRHVLHIHMFPPRFEYPKVNKERPSPFPSPAPHAFCRKRPKACAGEQSHISYNKWLYLSIYPSIHPSIYLYTYRSYRW